MPANKLTFQALLLSALMTASTGACMSADASKAPLSLEEIQTKRKETRDRLMVPSLEGIRGIAYQVIGYKNSEPLEKQMEKRLAPAGVPAFLGRKLKEGEGPVDAMVLISFYKPSPNVTLGELKVVQWTSLVRSPKSKIRSVTYGDKAYVQGDKPDEILAKLTDQFVLDFLKANQTKTAKTSKKSKEASGDSRQASKESKSKSK